MNIPQYRAKKIDSDEWVEGILLSYLKRFNNKSFIINDYTRMQDLDNAIQIDQKTISIHFPNMLDKNGSKIFASLSEDGVGGDELQCVSGIFIALMIGLEYRVYNKNIGSDKLSDTMLYAEVMGIHKGDEK